MCMMCMVLVHCSKSPLRNRRLYLGSLDLTPRFAHRPLLLPVGDPAKWGCWVLFGPSPLQRPETSAVKNSRTARLLARCAVRMPGNVPIVWRITERYFGSVAEVRAFRHGREEPEPDGALGRPSDATVVGDAHRGHRTSRYSFRWTRAPW